MNQEELAQQKQKKLDKLNELITSTKESAKSIAKDMRDKLELLKVCYERSSSKQKNKVHELTNYSQLICYLTEKPFSNSYETKPIELKHLVYTERSINRHIENGLPKNNNEQAIEIYSFYFGGYRAFFRCFGKEFLELRIKQKKEFIDDVYSTKDIDSEETGLTQHIVPCQKLNIIPSIRTEKSVLRIDILENLFNLFQNNKKVAINGISGIGKTFLAKHFTEYYEGKFSNMVWLNCAEGFPKAFSQEKGIGLLGGLGLAKEYDSYLKNEKGLMNLVIGNLAKIEGNNLLVLDNLDDSISSYKDELALISKYWNILGTSQQHLKDFENYGAPDFKRESLDLFYTFYTVEKDDDNLIRLLSAIEYHTLAIELLAKTADERGLSIIALVNRFTKKGINVVAQVEIKAEHGVERKKTTIKNIEEYLGIIFDTSSLKEEQCKILLNIALMQEDSIPMDLFEEVYLNNSSEEDIIDVFNYNLKVLVKKGWVKVENERIRLHGLVKGIILKRFLHRNEFFDSTVKYLRNVSGIDHTETILKRIKYLTLAESIVEKVTDEIHLKKIISLFYVRIGLYERANAFELNYLHQLYETQGIHDNEIEIMGRLYNLSSSLINQGKFEDVVKYSLELLSHLNDDVFQGLYSSLIDSLTFIFDENKVKNSFRLENISQFGKQISFIDSIWNSKSYVAQFRHDMKNSDKVRELKKVCESRRFLLNILEKNIPKGIIFTSSIYKNLLLSEITTYSYIGVCYFESGKYTNAEEIFKNVLKNQELILEKGHQNFFISSHYLTCLYRKTNNIEQAKYFLEKSKLFCNTFPRNHPYIAILKEDIIAVEKLENKKHISENLEKIIQSKFDILHEKNQNPEYYNELSSIYFKHENYEKANEYTKKEINVHLSTNNAEFYTLFNLYLKSGMCYFLLKDYNYALQSYDQALALCKEKNINNEEVDKRLYKFRKLLLNSAFKSNYIPIIRDSIKRELKILESKYKSLFLDSSKNHLTIIEKIFIFLFDLPDLRKILEGIEIIEEKMELFLADYDTLVNSIIKEFSDKEPIEINLTKIQYKILDEYYQTIADLFMKYERYAIAIQYCDKRLFLNQKHFEKSENIGTIYYNISNYHFKLDEFESSFETIRHAINSCSQFLESQNHSTEITKQTKLLLKNAFALEKKIKEELKNFRN